MAIYSEDEHIKCSQCGNDSFTEVELFRIVKKPVRTTLTIGTAFTKEVIGNKIQCTNCKNIMPNLIK